MSHDGSPLWYIEDDHDGPRAVVVNPDLTVFHSRYLTIQARGAPGALSTVSFESCV